jgi:predicted metal-binding membrane protein
MSVGAIEAVLKRDRTVVVTGLALITTLAWAYMFRVAWDMRAMDMGMEMAVPGIQPWGTAESLLVFVMWAVMMVAMMTPSASPMILTYSRVSRQRQDVARPLVATAAFVLGYLIVWTGFSAVATLAQAALHSAALLSPMMVSTSPVLGGVLLVAAGVFQFTPLKHACLAHCRSPLGFFMTDWREGLRGALAMGLRHGTHCVGCCWLLMTLLFVAGVMNLLWIAAIAAVVLVEKVAPAGHWVSRAIGVLVIAWGVWLAAGV